MKTIFPMTLLLALATGMAGCSDTNDRGVIIDHGGWFENWFGANTPATLPIVGTSPAPADSSSSASSLDSITPAVSADSAATPAKT